jgi:hypothetical protein
MRTVCRVSETMRDTRRVSSKDMYAWLRDWTVGIEFLDWAYLASIQFCICVYL